MATLIFFLTPTHDTYAAEVPISPAIIVINDFDSNSTSTRELAVKVKISQLAAKYGVSADEMFQTVSCETGHTFDHLIQSRAKRPDGTQEQSYGLAQIFLEQNPSVSYDEAIDPGFALEFMAQQFAAKHQNRWTCYTALKALRQEQSL